MATKRRSYKKKGGYFGLGSVVNTAIVPGALLAMQQNFRRKKNGGKTKKRKNSKRRR
jgi:hypothetical protein